MSGALKKSTGLTGLAVCRNPHQMLSIVHNKILRVLQKMPEDAAYRCYTEQIIQTRQQAVIAIKDVTELENHLKGGQVEEMLRQAEHELLLSRKMLDWRAWEPLQREAPEGQWRWPV